MEINGYVVLKDANGKTLVSGNNMIVKNGRLLVAYLVAKYFGVKNNVTDTNIFANNEGKAKFVISNGEGATSLNSSIKIDDNTKIFNISEEIELAESDTYGPYIKLSGTCVIDSTTSVFREAGILIGDKENNKTISRIAFDPVVVDASTTFTLDYYLYF